MGQVKFYPSKMGIGGGGGAEQVLIMLKEEGVRGTNIFEVVLRIDSSQ